MHVFVPSSILRKSPRAGCSPLIAPLLTWAGYTNRYFIYTPIKALLGCPSLFVRPALCGGDNELERDAIYGPYTDNALQWTFLPVDGQNPYTFKLVAAVSCSATSQAL